MAFQCLTNESRHACPLKFKDIFKASLFKLQTLRSLSQHIAILFFYFYKKWPCFPVNIVMSQVVHEFLFSRIFRGEWFCTVFYKSKDVKNLIHGIRVLPETLFRLK